MRMLRYLALLAAAQLILPITAPSAARGALIPGTLTGTVFAEVDGTPLEGFRVNLYDPIDFAGSILTDADGHYTFAGIPPGNYFVLVTAPPGSIYVSELWEDVLCGRSGAFNRCFPQLDGEPIPVPEGATVEGIDFALTVGGMIFGRVVDAVDGSPLEAAEVLVWGDDDGRFIAHTFTDADGRYALVGLVTGAHYASAQSDLHHVQLWDGIPCTGGVNVGCTALDGTPIDVEIRATVEGIDFALERAGVIEGEVVREQTGAPVRFSDVGVWDSRGRFVTRAFVSEFTGRYRTRSLPAGTYFATTRNSAGLFDELWDNLPCAMSECDPTRGTPITVVDGQLSGGIDFALAAGPPSTCTPTPTALCLNQGRFRIEAEWRDPAGNQGSGTPSRLTDDSGTFWFFNAANIELIVKVLDACGEPSNRYWVFAAGLTNVEVTLTVTDTLTGESEEYVNPLGTAFVPIQDTDAFASCP